MRADTNPGVYPGNPSLPMEVREKILSTFRHTLNLFQEGKVDDCLIGCDFILKMDARFSPARRLLEKARNPAAEVDVGELELLVAATPPRQERAASADVDRLLVRAVESSNARDFDAAISAAEQASALAPGNRNALEILEKARRKKAVQPQFDSARQRAIAALEAERAGDARRELETMRGLDPDHPAVALLERRIPGAPESSHSAPSPRQGLSASGLEEHFGFDSREPEIVFGEAFSPSIPIPAPIWEPPAGSGRASPGAEASLGRGHAAPTEAPLSLDSLSLDPPVSAAPAKPPPPGAASESRPFAGTTILSPDDLWTQAAPEPESGLPAADSGVELPLLEAEDLPPEALEPGDFAAQPASQDQEIQALLRQGDDAVGRGDHQQAIEIWSRIFLIDINNSEAVVRIEKARQEMAEGNRRISEGLKAGRESFEARDFATARERFLQVLAVDQNEPTARFYLDRIEQALSRPAEAIAPVPAGSREDILSGGPLASEVTAAMPLPAQTRPAGRFLRLSPKGLLFGLAAAFLLLAGIPVFLVLRSPEAKSAAVSAATPSLENAMVLFREGKVPETIEALRRIPKGHADYVRAQKLLASLTKGASDPGAPIAGSGGEASSPAGEASSPPAGENEPARLRAAAEKALAEKRYIDALKNFNLAAAAFSSDPDFAKARALATEKVTELTPAVKLYNEGEYETAIPILWRMHSEDRENQDARSYLLRAYYNQGVAQLQNGLYEKAMASFGEAIAIDPNDAEAARHRKFAGRYHNSDLDLMGRIYVRHIQPRP